jgi:secreted protein with Ig-like and vWFA domain
MNSNHDEENLRELDEANLTAYALGQLEGRDFADVEALLLRSDKARRFVEETSRWAGHVRDACQHGPSPEPSATLRETIENELQKQSPSTVRSSTMSTAPNRKRSFAKYFIGLCAVGAAAAVVVAIVLPARQAAREAARLQNIGVGLHNYHDAKGAYDPSYTAEASATKADSNGNTIRYDVGKPSEVAKIVGGAAASPAATAPYDGKPVDMLPKQSETPAGAGAPPGYGPPSPVPSGKLPGYGPPSGQGTRNVDEMYAVERSLIPANDQTPIAYPNAEFWRQHDVGGKPADRDQHFKEDDKPGVLALLPPASPTEPQQQGSETQHAAEKKSDGTLYMGVPVRMLQEPYYLDSEVQYYPTSDELRKLRLDRNTEQYDPIRDNAFLSVSQSPLSTFSIDVDTASYANIRRFLREGRLPPPDAVRIEEMINYFPYNYSPPTDGTPFAVAMETAQCPWRTEHRLLRIALKGREIDRKNRGASNIVFLLDVSGSMSDANKLSLVKEAMKMLVGQLQEDDRVAIVTYASDTRVVLPSARGNERERITTAIDALQAGGCTYGSGGIQLAYQQAAEHFVQGGVNRVILCTDGDLNVGVTRDEDLVEMIQEKAKTGVFLTVLGFGEGNLKDSKMQKLADKGNGIYAYIDGLREAHRVLVEQMIGSLVTIAKDVKIQIEFNPAAICAYRLIGYEKRVMANQDFNDDKKDAGEIGAGHTVTALYELVPNGADESEAADEPGLKYQKVPKEKLAPAADSSELLTLKIRYKEPEQNTSKLLEFAAKDSDRRFGEASPDFRFAASVASFGMMLRSSPYRGNLNYAAVAEFAAGALDHDPNGYRAEFLDLVRQAASLASRSPQ